LCGNQGRRGDRLLPSVFPRVVRTDMPDPQGPPKAPERVWDELLRDESPVERNRALAVRWFRQVWNERRTETTHGVHGPIRGVHGRRHRWCTAAGSTAA